MNLLQLKYFREAVICGSVTRAARRLHVTQPAVSKQLSLLAEEFNCELWNKHKRNLRLTEAGRIVFSPYGADPGTDPPDGKRACRS